MKYKRGVNIKLADNFRAGEFDCPCSYSDCAEFLVAPMLVKQLQVLRDHIHEEIKITSGFRCSKHNDAIGGSNASYHKYGLAADIRTVSRENMLELYLLAKDLTLVGAIGSYNVNGVLSRLHIDFRPRPKSGIVEWSK